MENSVVIGAGISGLTIARILAEKNHKVRVFEKELRLGGSCADVNIEDTNVHIFGPHIFHTNNKEVWQFINRFSKFNNYIHKVFTTYYKNELDEKILTFPITLQTFKEVFNKNVYSLDDAKSIIYNDIKQRYDIKEEQTVEDIIDKQFNNKDNFETAVIKAVGPTLYEIFFKSYTERQWNCKCSELSASLLGRVPARLDSFNTQYFLDEYQGMPVQGYNQMFKNLADHENIEIIYGFNVDEMNLYGEIDNLIFCGDIDTNNILPYRSLNFSFDKIKKEDSNYSVRNFANIHELESDKRMTRITNYNILHGDISKEKHIICKESACENNSINKLYPINNDENNKLFKDIQIKHEETFLKQYPYISRIEYLGRLATYKYLNMDAAIEQAINLGKSF